MIRRLTACLRRRNPLIQLSVNSSAYNGISIPAAFLSRDNCPSPYDDVIIADVVNNLSSAVALPAVPADDSVASTLLRDLPSFRKAALPP